MPKYKSQISQITEYVYPLYVAFYKWDTSSLANFDGKIQITNVIVNNLKPFDKELNEKQMNDVVDGLVEYIKNFSNYYIRQFNINSNIDEIRPRNNEEFERILRNPYRNYLDEVRINYKKLLSNVKEEFVSVEENRESKVYNISYRNFNICNVSINSFVAYFQSRKFLGTQILQKESL